MKFYDREAELELLERVYSQPGSDFVIISGRRRVGKSHLIDAFIKGRKAVSVLIVPKEEMQVAKDIEDEVRSKLGYSPSFSSFREAMEYLFERNAEIICIDEFPNLLAVNPSIPFELQRLWDKVRGSKEIMLLVSGSYAGMMNRIFTARKAPLFNRATMTLQLQPLTFKTAAEMLADLGVRSPREQVSFYCVFGGIPYYYLLLERLKDRSFESAINSLFFDVGAQLSDEGENVLRQEFGNAYAKHYAILESMGSGSVSMNEISQKLGVRSTTLTKYMHVLQHDFKLICREVPFGENLARSKRGIYCIKDNMLAFWFSKVYGKRSAPGKEGLNSFVGIRFKALSRDFLLDYLEKRGEKILKSGKWWGSVAVGNGRFEQREIDLVVETDEALYLGECKWASKKVGEAELERLKASSSAFMRAGSGARKPIRFVLFSKMGFEMGAREGILMFDPERIIGEQ